MNAKPVLTAVKSRLWYGWRYEISSWALILIAVFIIYQAWGGPRTWLGVVGDVLLVSVAVVLVQRSCQWLWRKARHD